MNEAGNRYALAALKDRRATLAGEIVDLKKQLAWRVSQLDHVDACLTIFEPGFDIKAIGIKRPRKRVKLFRQGELGRLIIDALILTGPITDSFRHGRPPSRSSRKPRIFKMNLDGRVKPGHDEKGLVSADVAPAV